VKVLVGHCVDCGHPFSALGERRLLSAADAHDAWKHPQRKGDEVALRAMVRQKTVRINVSTRAS
jgi:hypothetical protein